MGGSLESKRQAVVLRDAFKDLSSKWAKEIETTFAETKTHFEVAGGNYTFFFVLPPLFKAFRKKHPFLRLKLDLLELRDGNDLARKNADLVLSSRYLENDSDSVDYSSGAKENGYSVLRKKLF
jgi:DNA-binding transcriptional LysR family regulator